MKILLTDDKQTKKKADYISKKQHQNYIDPSGNLYVLDVHVINKLSSVFI